MKSISIKQFAEVIGAEIIGGADGMISGIAIDSRIVKNGDAFFAINGSNYDGHDFVQQAGKVAGCVVVDKDVEISKDVTVLRTDDTIRALGAAAKYNRENSSAKVIAITGSVGKTSCRNMIYHVLSGFYKCHQAKKSFNNNIGLPLTLLETESDCEIVVTEIGTNRPGEIETLTKIASPDIGLITNVHPAHLAGFGDIDAIKKEKAAISKGIREDGILIINSQTEGLVDYCNTDGLKILTFGNDVANIKLTATNSSFSINRVKIKLPLAGKGNFENALAAWAVCKNIGITIQQFAERISTIRAIGMRMEILKIKSGTILNDCYNANPASMENAIDILSMTAAKENKRAVFVCGPMGELGGHSEKYHRQLGQKVAIRRIPLLLSIEGDCANTITAAQNAKGSVTKCQLFKNIESLCNNLQNFVKADDIILVKASRSEHFEIVCERLRKILNKTG